MKLAIVTTHPIQYYAPVFKLLHQSQQVNIMVYYTWGEKSNVKYDPGFDSTIGWDIPLLEGYPYTWLENTSPDPGTHHYRGIINPDIIAGIEQWGPDAILIYGWAWQSHLKCIRHFKGRLPVYFRGDSTLFDERPGFKSSLKTLFLKWVYNRIDCAFYTGSSNKAYFKKYGLSEGQLVFAPHAVENERFSQNRKEEADTLRQRLSIPDEAIMVLFAGKFEDKKSPLELLEAFLRLDKPGVYLLFVGNGILETKLKQQAERAGNIRFMDFQNQSRMPVVLQACDLFCLPSKGPGETWGLVVNEAMAAGKPVLVSNKAGCAADLVLPGVNGDIFKAGDANDLLLKLTLLTDNKNTLRSYGSNAKTKIAEWSFRNQVTAITNKLTRLEDAE